MAASAHRVEVVRADCIVGCESVGELCGVSQAVMQYEWLGKLYFILGTNRLVLEIAG